MDLSRRLSTTYSSCPLAVVRCEACFRNGSQFLSGRHLKPAVTQRPNWTSRRIATEPSGCVVVHAADTKIRRCNRSARRYATALPVGAQHVLSTVIPHRHSKLLVRYTLPALQDSEPASLQSESLCRSHAAPAGRQVESPRCAGPSRTGGYAAHPLNLGTINVHDDNIIIDVAVEPRIFNLGEASKRRFRLPGAHVAKKLGSAS